VTPDRVGLATRVLSHSSDVVVGVSPAATAALRAAGLAADRSATILNAVEVAPGRTRAEVRAELGIPDDADVVVTVGRYAPEKNQALLLDALARLLPSHARMYALLVGHGLLEDELRDRAARIAAERIRVTGARLDAIDIVAASDVFVLSSDSEAFPLALLEAMGAGLPVVTTDVGGVRDAVADGRNGLVVPPRDPDALAAAIAKLVDDATSRAALGASAREFVAAHCSLATMVDAYLELYSEVASRGRRRASARRAGASPSK
jgi:glycosyltransferase involved in cell wall biosynthesis